LSHKLEVGERCSLASHYTLTTAFTITINLHVTLSQAAVTLHQAHGYLPKHIGSLNLANTNIRQMSLNNMTGVVT